MASNHPAPEQQAWTFEYSDQIRTVRFSHVTTYRQSRKHRWLIVAARFLGASMGLVGALWPHAVR
jgi:hypothetical protein